MSKQAPSAPRVYSYIRFSTPEQLKGDSLRRQLEASKKWCEDKAHVLDTNLKLHDLGVSARFGQNAVHGKLGVFLKAIKDGKVKDGDILPVESLDRMSRDQIGDALERFLGILRSGVSIVTLNPEEEFTKADRNDLVKLITAIVIMSRAYEESETKSKRIKAARDKARQDAREKREVLTCARPAWLDVWKDGRQLTRDEIKGGAGRNGAEFKRNEAAAKTIQLIFKWKRAGDSIRVIERRLNAEASWTPPKRKDQKTAGWRASYIRKILTNRAVIGEYQPHELHGGRNGKRTPSGDPIPDYFPQVVKSELFHAVQEQMHKNKSKGGRNGKNGKHRNLFKGLLVCPYCGGPMHFEDKGQPPKGATYLFCYDERRGHAQCKNRIRYDEVEAALLANCPRLRPEQVLPSKDEENELCSSLRERIAAATHELDENEAKQVNLVDQIANTKHQAVRDQYEEKLVKLTERKATLQAQLEADRRELAQAEAGRRSLEQWQTGLASLKKALADDEPDLRQRLNSHLRELITKIEIYGSGPGWLVPEVLEDRITESNPNWRPDKEFKRFSRWLARQGTTKKARFLRIHFTSARGVDIIPEGSIYHAMFDNFDALHEQFNASRQRVVQRAST